jgi:uncharacterized protein with GYD domain
MLPPGIRHTGNKPDEEVVMPKFVLMTRLSPEAVRDADVRRAMGRAWLNKVKAACPEVTWVAHYAILGPYDFMDIYEAPTVEAAHKVSVISRAEGAVSAESWQAMPYDDFLGLLEDVET